MRFESKSKEGKFFFLGGRHSCKDLCKGGSVTTMCEEEESGYCGWNGVSEEVGQEVRGVTDRGGVGYATGNE